MIFMRNFFIVSMACQFRPKTSEFKGRISDFIEVVINYVFSFMFLKFSNPITLRLGLN